MVLLGDQLTLKLGTGFEVIGKEKCPIVDTWWQTETGSIMISPLPGVTPLKAGSACLPFFGVDADVVDEEGNSVPLGTQGYLVIKNLGLVC